MPKPKPSQRGHVKTVLRSTVTPPAGSSKTSNQKPTQKRDVDTAVPSRETPRKAIAAATAQGISTTTKQTTQS